MVVVQLQKRSRGAIKVSGQSEMTCRHFSSSNVAAHPLFLSTAGVVEMAIK